jgi:hypothetical protein
MKYKIQDRKLEQKEYVVFMIASNGEVCKEICRCRDPKDAELINSLLNNTESSKSV